MCSCASTVAAVVCLPAEAVFQAMVSSGQDQPEGHAFDKILVGSNGTLQLIHATST